MKKFFITIAILFSAFLIIKYAARPFICDVANVVESMYGKDSSIESDHVDIENIYEDDCGVEEQNEEISDYNRYLEEADYYRNFDNPHSINLVLGSLYMAYVSTDDQFLKECVKELIRGEYENSPIILSARWNGGIHFLIREENSRPLPGFEYNTIYGTWETPSKFMDHDQNPSFDLYDRAWASAENVPINEYTRITGNYRFLYEKMVNGKLVRIQVPDDFHYMKYL